jgi:hypothetical protein
MGVDPAHGSEQCQHVYRSSTVHHGTRHACSSRVGLSLLACLFAGKLKAHFEDADIKYIEPTTMIRCASKQCNVWSAGTLGQPLQLLLVDVGSMRLRRVVTHRHSGVASGLTRLLPGPRPAGQSPPRLGIGCTAKCWPMEQCTQHLPATRG